MIDLENLGWAADTVGELDHRSLKVPSVKLRGAHVGAAGDVIYCIDLRFRQPNARDAFTPAQAHSLEHFLLEGFQRLLAGHFVSIGVMGCRTGFYLNLMNEGRRAVIETALQQILSRMLRADAVPFARIDQCGHWQDHDLAGAQEAARTVLAAQTRWSLVT